MRRVRRSRFRRGLMAGLSLATLTACSGGNRDRLQPEQFGSTTTHARDYAAASRATCEAARRTLLSQGYVITLADGEHVNGKKNFQPEPATHVEVEFHVVCAAADRQGHKSIAFVNALEDRYALKKSNNSASLGVGVLGSVSLPFTSSDDAMVKIASETITTDAFYESFFALLDRYLAVDTAAELPLPPEPASAASAARPRPGRTPVEEGAAASGPEQAASAP